MTDRLAVVSGSLARSVLEADRTAVMDVVARAYTSHSTGHSHNPDSLFLRLPGDRNRIIALPAYLGDGHDLAGLKWIASVPANVERNQQRASAVILLNSLETGQPVALLEGSAISAHRTAAIATIAARGARIGRGGRQRYRKIAVVGAGVIAREIMRYLASDGVAADRVDICDLVPASAEALTSVLRSLPFDRVGTVATVEAAFHQAELIVLATTSGTPYIDDPALLSHAPTVLNVSLRDLSVAMITAGQNFVDDIEHCLKAQTSPHLAEMATGSRDFVSGTIHDLMIGSILPDPSRARIISPFGLGVLDVAVAAYCLDQAIRVEQVIYLPDFVGDASRY